MSKRERRDLTINNALIPGHSSTSDILIKDGIIADIGSFSKDGIDAGERLVTSGFVNAHTHLDKADLLSRMGPADFGKTLEENRELLKGFKRDYSVGEIRERARRVIMEFVAQGVTAIRTQVDVDGTGGLKPVEALSGLRDEIPIELQICAFPQEGVLDEGARSQVEQALEAGADLMGGLPMVEKSEEGRTQHIDVLFEIAKAHNVDLDIQMDESNDPREFMLPTLIEKTIENGWQDRVAATHCISLSAQDEAIASRTIELVGQAGISVITTPSANMITRFGLPADIRSRPSNSIAPLKELLDGGVNVAIGTDNIRDIFYPVGNCSMLREMHVAVAATRMTGEADPARLFGMASANGGRILGLDYGVRVGAAADLVILNGSSYREVLNSPEYVPAVISGGRVVCETGLEVEYG